MQLQENVKITDLRTVQYSILKVQFGENDTIRDLWSVPSNPATWSRDVNV